MIFDRWWQNPMRFSNKEGSNYNRKKKGRKRVNPSLQATRFLDKQVFSTSVFAQFYGGLWVFPLQVVWSIDLCY